MFDANENVARLVVATCLGSYQSERRTHPRPGVPPTRLEDLICRYVSPSEGLADHVLQRVASHDIQTVTAKSRTVGTDLTSSQLDGGRLCRCERDVRLVKFRARTYLDSNEARCAASAASNCAGRRKVLDWRRVKKPRVARWDSGFGSNFRKLARSGIGS